MIVILIITTRLKSSLIGTYKVFLWSYCQGREGWSMKLWPDDRISERPEFWPLRQLDSCINFNI